MMFGSSRTQERLSSSDCFLDAGNDLGIHNLSRVQNQAGCALGLCKRDYVCNISMFDRIRKRDSQSTNTVRNC
jgi:hypothetical protein